MAKSTSSLEFPTSELSATWLNQIEQTLRMLLISSLATRKAGKGAAKTNLRSIIVGKVRP